MLQVSCISPDWVPALNIKHRDDADVADSNACCLFAQACTPTAAPSHRH